MSPGRAFLPSREHCILLLEKHGCPGNVINHALAVEKLAVEISRLVGADSVIVSPGALLHDIGRCVTHGIHHALESARILEEEGVDRRLVDIALRHLGAGVDEEDRKAIGFPPGNYIPITLEEKIVAHADNLIKGDACGCLDHFVERMEKAGFPRAAQRAIILHEELSNLAGEDLDEVCKRVIGKTSTQS
ncbi:MAG: HDIG domain-containing protein [Candidatus Thermoplasmatota archaeon]|nr:HDIG domain-containing protein [Candidatus Thermoplasmatota archaeon]